MPEHISAAKNKREPHKPPVKASSPQPEIESPINRTPTLSPQQVLHLQRTVGNKAVADMLRQSKTADAKPAENSAAPIELHTSANIIQPLFGKKKKEEAPAPPPPPVVSAPQNAAPTADVPAANSDIAASDEQMANPVLALKTYREAVGVHLREGKRHKFKIDRYKAFIEADFGFIKSNTASLVEAQKSLIAQESLKAISPAIVKSLKAKRAALEKESKEKLGEINPMVAEAKAEARVAKAYNASMVAESELPLIEYAYDTLVKMRHEGYEGTKHGTLRGSGNPYERLKFYEKKLEYAELVANSNSGLASEKAKAANAKDAVEFRKHIAKHKARIAAIEQARKDLIKAQMLRGQAKLSEDMMAVKRKQLKVEKAEIKGVAGRGVTLASHLGSKVTSGAASAALSTVTLGLVEVEQNKADGGYSSKREIVSIVGSWKRDWAALKSVWTSRPYGKMTALHLFFQGLGSLILKPLRKMFTAASLIFTGLSLIPPLAPITGPLAAFCTLVTLGLVAAKMAVDTLLATWSALTLALNKNAHNTDVLRGQAVGQVADVAAGAVAAGSAFAIPALGDAVGGQYVNPLQNLNSHGGSVMSYNPGQAGATGGIGDQLAHQAQVQGAKLPATLGMVVGEKAVGALAELEGLGAGAKALFLTRQNLIMSQNLQGPQLYIELEKAKLAALEYEEGYLNKRIRTFSSPEQNKPEKVAAARKKLAVVEQQLVGVRAKIAADGRGLSTPMAAPSAPTTARNIDSFDHSTTAIPAQGQFASFINPEVQKEQAIREASTQALAAKAKSQVQGLLGGVRQSQSQSGEMASGAQAAVSGVAAAGPSQGVQPVDAPNASAAQENVSAGQDILQQVLAIAEAAPAAVDEAITPAPVSG